MALLVATLAARVGFMPLISLFADAITVQPTHTSHPESP